jgi:hypothetical protein
MLIIVLYYIIPFHAFILFFFSREPQEVELRIRDVGMQ